MSAGGRPALALALALASSCLALAGCGSSASTGHAPKQGADLVSIGAGLEGPAGLKATVYAKGPLTAAAFAFDAQGRLWVSAAGLETHSHDGVYMIAGAGASPVKVISGLDDPIGLVWHQDRLYVASVGRVDVYSGFDGRHFEQHHELLGGPAAGAENNLLVMAPDGRFLMGITQTCDHCRPSSKYAGAVVSFAPNGSDLRVYAGRIRAPFGLAFYPGTEDLFVTMNQQDNLGAETPGDALALVGEGEDWRFPECHDQGGSACAGVPKPTAMLDEHAAVGGVAILTGQLGGALAGSAIVPEWARGKVQRVALRRSGTSFSGSVAPFLKGILHPLAIAIAPDRSLLIGDWQTGTIYRISQT